jgi:Tfp pilus assembly protein PilF
LRRPFWWIIALTLVAALAALAAIAATPPNLAKTIEAQQRLAAERPQDAGVFNDLGNLLALANRPDEAEAAYRRAVELDPQRASALFNLGLLLVQKGGHKEAFDLFSRVVEREPKNAWAHYELGAVHERFGRRDKAIQEYAQAFALDPQLALPDVNPHVIDSELTTEAMLRAYRGGYGAPRAPKIYDDPNRIAAMLVPPPAKPKDETAAGSEAGTVRQGAAPGQAAPGAAPGAAQGSRVLRQNTIDRGGALGQATQPGIKRPPAPPRQPGSIARPSVRAWTRPDPGTVVDEEENGDVEDQGGEVYTPPSVPGSGFIYQPNAPSSGRLDVRVVPDRLAAAHPGFRRGRR